MNLGVTKHSQAVNDSDLANESPNSSEPIVMKITATSFTIILAIGFALPDASGQEPVQQQSSAESAVNHSAFRPVTPSPATSGFQPNSTERPLKVKIYSFYNKLPVNDKCLVAIELDIAKGWHINANPANPEWMKATVVTLKTKHDIKLSKIKYPKHHKLPVEGSPDPYYVYDGKAIVYGLLDIKNLTPEEPVELEFHVNFQGCNSDQCLPPDSIVMKGKLPVAAVGETLQKVNAEKFPKPKKKAEQRVKGK